MHWIKSNLDCVFLDLDGTLVDSSEAILRAPRCSLAESGLAGERLEGGGIAGPPQDDTEEDGEAATAVGVRAILTRNGYGIFDPALRSSGRTTFIETREELAPELLLGAHS